MKPRLPNVWTLVSLLTVACLLPGSLGAQALGPGDQAPGFTAPDQYGRAVSLSDFAGSFVVLDFCAHWCLPCRQANLQSRALIDALRGAGVPFVYVTALLEGSQQGVASSQPDAEIWGVVFDLPPGHPVLHLGGSYASELLANFSTYGTNAFPTYVVIHPDGTIVHIQAGLDEQVPIATLLKDVIDPNLPDPDPDAFLDSVALTYDQVRVMFAAVGAPAVTVDDTFGVVVDGSLNDRGGYVFQARLPSPIGFLPGTGEALLQMNARLFLKPLDAAAIEDYRSFDVGSFLTVELRNVQVGGVGVPVAAIPNAARILGLFHSEVFGTSDLEPELAALPQSFDDGVLRMGPLVLTDFFQPAPDTTLQFANRLDIRLGVRMIAPHFKTEQARTLILALSPRRGPAGQAAGWLAEAQSAITVGAYGSAATLLGRVERLVPQALGLGAVSAAQVGGLLEEVRTHLDFMAAR